MSDNAGIRLLGKVHARVWSQRRMTALAERLATMLPPGARLLDVGCGDGRVAALLKEAVPGLEIEGAEVLPRADCAIPCHTFDGVHLPFPDGSFDGCMFVDVVHHAKNPLAILREGCRVSRQFLLIKDHLAENLLDRWTLRLMDWVGNRPTGVALPYTYLSRVQWQDFYSRLGLELARTDAELPLYPRPLSTIFGRKLHFISLLSIRPAAGL